MDLRDLLRLKGLGIIGGGGGSSDELYDKTLYPMTSGWIHGGDGISSSGSSYKKTSDFVPCERAAGRQVTLNKRPGGGNPGFAFYTSESVESFISGEKNNTGEAGTPWTVWVPNTAKYMRFTVPADATNVSVKIEKTTELYDAELYPITNGRYIDNTGDVSWNSGCAATIGFIPCEIAAGKKLLLNKRPSGRTVPCIAFYYSAEKGGFISAVKNNGETVDPWIVDVPANAKYVRISTLAGATDLSLIIAK